MLSLQEKLKVITTSLLMIQIGDWSYFDRYVLNALSHEGQFTWLKTSFGKRENVLHPGNGWGKTEVIARKHIAYHLLNFDFCQVHKKTYKTLNVAITLEQASFVFDRIISYCENSPILRGWFIKSYVRNPLPVITFFSGSQAEFKTTKRKGESIEGKEYGYISADEIALEPHIEFIREAILLPRLRNKYMKFPGLDFYATPKGKNAYWRVTEDIARHGGFIMGGSSYDNPHADHALFDYFMQTWSKARIQQTIFGKFIDTGDMMFASRVPVLFSLDNEELTEATEKGRCYIEGWDLARGRRGIQADQTVGYRLLSDKLYNKIVFRWAFQLPWTEKERENINQELGQIKEYSSIEREIRNAHAQSHAHVLLDSTGVGDTLYGIVQDIATPVDFRGGRKDEILDHLQAVIDSGKLKAPFIPELADEMTTYQRDDKNLDTDNVMALAIASSAITIDTIKYGTLT